MTIVQKSEGMRSGEGVNPKWGGGPPHRHA